MSSSLVTHTMRPTVNAGNNLAMPCVVCALPFTTSARVAVACISLCTLLGCGSSKPVEQMVSTSDDVPPQRRRVVLEHDFGLLYPQQTVSHRFPIKNDTAIAWTFRNAITSCGCTVADLSSGTIAPGSSEYATVRFSRKTAPHDEKRKVGLVFAESEAPVIELLISAKVRAALTVLPEKLVFRQLGRGQVQTADIEIQNFSERDWTGIEITSSEDSLTASWVPTGTSDLPGKPRQSWRGAVRIEASMLKAGRHEMSLFVRPLGGVEPAQELSVHANVISAVRAIPAQLFFGRVHAGTSTTRSIKLQFAPDVPRVAEKDIKIEHPLGNQLSFRWSDTDTEVWELMATLSLADDFIPSESGTLRIAFSNRSLPNLELPIYLMIDESRGSRPDNEH